MKNALDDIIAAHGATPAAGWWRAMPPRRRWPKQIEQGAPADVFISADQEWMDYVVQKKLIAPSRASTCSANRLVLIAPKDSKIDNVTIGPASISPKSSRAMAVSRVGDVRAGAAGKYAKRRWRSSAH